MGKTDLERVEAKFQRIVDTVDDFCDPYKASEQLRETLYVIQHMAQRGVLMVRGMIKEAESK